MSEQASEGKTYPPRYQVTRTGTPDPEAARYLVLDVVHDVNARALAARYANNLRDYARRPERAQEVEDFLAATKEAHRAFCERMNEINKRDNRTEKAHAARAFS